MTPKYSFIVGSSRTGTTLLVRCLDRSSEISMQGQMHFMGHLLRSGLRQDIAKIGQLTDDGVVRQVVDYIYAAPYRGGAYWRWFIKNVDRECFTQKILDSDRSERSLFTILLETGSNNKPMLGEKTPGNLFHVPTLLEWFPNAKIVHTIRDPRAVYVSETRYRINQQKSGLFPYKQIEKLGLKKLLLPGYTFLHTTVVFSRVLNLHAQYQQRYPDNYCVSKFEDLVTNPEGHLRNICNFLEVKFEEAMLDQVVINTGFKSELGKAGFDKNAADRWRKHIGPVANTWFSFLWKQQLKDLGYVI